MIKYLSYVIFLIFSFQDFYAQDGEILNSENISQLNKIIDSLEETYKNRQTPKFYSLPQTTANYFEISTDQPEEFLKLLPRVNSFEELVDLEADLQIDTYVFIIKNIYANSKGEKEVEIKSFEIGNSGRSLIRLDYDDFLKQDDYNYYYSIYTRKGITNIRGFYLIEDFKVQQIPEKYADWTHYTDFIVQPEEDLFYNSAATPFYHRDTTAVDTLVDYFADVTEKPIFKKDQDFKEFIKQKEEWEGKRAVYADSLFENDRKFKSLLFRAVNYAREEKKSNGELEYFTARLVSKPIALDFMRNNRQVGTCSFDNGPLMQQKRMAALAADIPNWNVFIQSFMNVLNDNVSRIANNNIASNARKTYIEELQLLDIDLRKLLLGTNMRISDTARTHYFSNGSKVGKAFAQLNKEQQTSFENELIGLIKDKGVDTFNKLHFYNTYRNYQYFLSDSVHKIAVEKKIDTLIGYLPYSIGSRLTEPNKQLKNLLHKEKDKLEKFDIIDSSIGNIYSYSYGGDCWMALIQEKNANEKIIYNLTMPMEKEITPFQNFLEQKEELTKRVKNHDFLQELVATNPDNKIHIRFTKDRSFANFRERITKEMPESLKAGIDWEDAISLYINYPGRKNVNYILLKNKNIIMLNIPRDYSIPGYSFEELLTEKEESFLHTTYKAYRLFNEDGKMLQ